MARERPTASDVAPPTLSCLDGGKPDGAPPLLSRAAARALRRSAPVPHVELKNHLEGITDALPPSA